MFRREATGRGCDACSGKRGFVERQNAVVDSRWAEGRYDRLPALVAEFLRSPPVDMIFAGGPPAAIAAKAVTTTIPIVFTSGVDPVKLGLVASFIPSHDGCKHGRPYALP